MYGYRRKPFRSLVLDTFDRLSAPVEHRYVWSELQNRGSTTPAWWSTPPARRRDGSSWPTGHDRGATVA